MSLTFSDETGYYVGELGVEKRRFSPAGENGQPEEITSLYFWSSLQEDDVRYQWVECTVPPEAFTLDQQGNVTLRVTLTPGACTAPDGHPLFGPVSLDIAMTPDHLYEEDDLSQEDGSVEGTPYRARVHTQTWSSYTVSAEILDPLSPPGLAQMVYVPSASSSRNLSAATHVSELQSSQLTRKTPPAPGMPIRAGTQPPRRGWIAAESLDAATGWSPETGWMVGWALRLGVVVYEYRDPDDPGKTQREARLEYSRSYNDVEGWFGELISSDLCSIPADALNVGPHGGTTLKVKIGPQANCNRLSGAGLTEEVEFALNLVPDGESFRDIHSRGYVIQEGYRHESNLHYQDWGSAAVSGDIIDPVVSGYTPQWSWLHVSRGRDISESSWALVP